MICRFSEQLRRKLHAPPEDWEGVLAVLTADEFAALDPPAPLRPPETLRLGEARYCRLLIEADRISGRLYIPAYQGQPVRDLLFLWWQETLLLIDKGDLAQSCAERVMETHPRASERAGDFLVEFLLALTADEPGRMQQLEDRVASLEQAVLGNETDTFVERISDLRKELNRRSRYYAQLGEMSALLAEGAADRFTAEALKRLGVLEQRVKGLREETQLLREYASQVSSEYQAQVDIAQNRIMKVLTVVTTLFLPLTLIAGWYGMNFHAMPELDWRFGYPAVILLSALVVIACLIFFKRHHYW